MLHKIIMITGVFSYHRFAVLCQYLLREKISTDQNCMERFAKDFLPSLLALSTDAVPNVRLALARTLTQSILPIGEYRD